MMDQTHIGYTAWNDPPANAMPAVSWIQVPEAGSLGVDAEDATLERAGGRFGFSLGTIDSVSDETRTLTLFDRGKTPVKFTVQTSAPWIVAIRERGNSWTRRRRRSCFAWIGARCPRARTAQRER